MPPAGSLPFYCYPSNRGYDWSVATWDGCAMTTTKGGFVLDPAEPLPDYWPCGH